MTEAVLATGFFAFARLTALFLVLPVFATQGVPKHVPVFFGLILTLLLLPAMPVVEGELTLGFLVSGIVSEALLGYLLVRLRLLMPEILYR